MQVIEINYVPWYRQLTKYHWFVFIVAALGWLFDTMDQQLFILSREDAIKDLLPRLSTPDELTSAGTLATAIFLIGWATGGLFFGVLGDRIGRVKTMLYTILLYSIFTGLSIFARGFWDFAAYRFLTGLGVGGEFAVGVALVAEAMPATARPRVLGLLQACSALGNIIAAMIYLGLGFIERAGHLKDLIVPMVGSVTSWKIAYVCGSVPAMLCIIIRRKLKEPVAWKQTKAEGTTRLGSYNELLTTPILRKRALLGLMLGFAAVVGLWSIAFFAIKLQTTIFINNFKAQGITGTDLTGNLTIWKGVTSMMINLGGFVGMYGFGWVTSKISRKATFAIAFVGALISTVCVFWFFEKTAQVFWLMPIMGCFQLSLFSGLAIYLPELFPTRLRSTGTSFCYNVGRFVAASGPLILGLLITNVFTAQHGFTREPMRYAGVAMCSVFLIGLLALPFLPETKDKPLPE